MVTIMSRSEVAALILSTVAWESQTTESLLLRIVAPTWSPVQIRLIVAGMLQSGRLDMRPDGRLIVCDESPEPPVQSYAGSWYAVTKEGVKGPYRTHGEAYSVNDSVCASGGKQVERHAE